MRLALFGAAGGIGSAVLAQALASGHEVRALVRDASRLAPQPGLTVIGGDARSADVVSEVLRGTEAAVTALGPRANTLAAADELLEAAQTIVTAMERQGVRRLVLVAGAGVDLPGDRKGPVHRVAGVVVRLFARHVVAAKERELELVRGSGLDWTAVRPVRVQPGPASGRFRVSLERPAGMRCSSGDIAAFIVKTLEERAHVREAPFIATGPSAGA